MLRMREESFRYLSSFVRPVRFAAGNTLWGVGSCVLVTLNGQFYGVTARHVIGNQGADFQDTRILMPDTSVSLPMLGHFCPKSEMLESWHLDIVVYKIDAESYFDFTGQRLPAMNLGEHFYPAKHFPMEAFAVCGYPATDDRYDYDRKKLVDHLLIKTGRISASEFGEPIFKLESSASEYPFNGMSGSPVFGVLSAIRRVMLVGLVVRGTESSGIFHFIDFTVVLSSILQHQGDQLQTSS